MSQLTQNSSVPKHKVLRHFVEPLTGGPALVTLEGAMWKRWRATFNPGFGVNHIMTLVPSMVEEMMVFKNIIQAHAEKGDMFHLEELTLNLTIDVIGRVAMYVTLLLLTTINLTDDCFLGTISLTAN